MRLASLFAGAVAAIAIAALAGAQEHRDLHGCRNGHPIKRIEATYGGVHGKRGYQRDHVCPLGLGCPDVASNVKYQRCEEFGAFGKCLRGPAAKKDGDEDTAIEKYCSEHWSPDYAKAWLAERWPVDKAHGYDFE
jgi:hypothetical protein